MKCLRCGAEMKHYKWFGKESVYGKEHQLNPFVAAQQDPHNPKSIYECEECGYCELSTNPCENEDI